MTNKDFIEFCIFSCIFIIVCAICQYENNDIAFFRILILLVLQSTHELIKYIEKE